jgi:hypothetical protein
MVFSAKNFDFLKLHVQRTIICIRNPHIFWNIFEQIKHHKQSFFVSNMPCFSKMVSTNGNGFPLKGHRFPIQGVGFPLQGVSTNGKLVYSYSTRKYIILH